MKDILFDRLLLILTIVEAHHLLNQLVPFLALIFLLPQKPLILTFYVLLSCLNSVLSGLGEFL